MAYTSDVLDHVRRIQLLTADIAPEAIARDLAALARSSLREAIHSGEGNERNYRYVNGRYNASEDSVVPPGPIFYVFHWWNEIVEYAVAELKKRSPVKTGRYQKSFVVMVNGSPVIDYTAIPIGAAVLIVNVQPYSRKIEVGHMKMSVPDGVVEDTLTKVRRRFSNIADIRFTMTTIPDPYILKGVFKRGYKAGARTKIRKDTMAGSMMTYPALSITMRV